ncbi:MAG: PKD domain-containing protein [Anaerolineae bacterium]|nr:PKD domain-containing protein [Anaerolineae bacterium]
MRKLLIAFGIFILIVALRPTTAGAQTSEVWATDWIIRRWDMNISGTMTYADGQSMGNHPSSGEFIGVIARYYDVVATSEHANGSQLMGIDFRDQAPYPQIVGSFNNYGTFTWTVHNYSACLLYSVRAFSGLPDWTADHETICAAYGAGDETYTNLGTSAAVSGAARANFVFHWGSTYVANNGVFAIRYLYYGTPPPTAGCSADPEPDIYGVVVGDIPLEVTFTNTSTNATSYSWDFDDGETSTDAEPVHTFDDPGFYTVVLTATNSIGSDTCEIEIHATSPFGLTGQAGRPLGPYDRIDWEGAYEGMWDYSGLPPGVDRPPIYANSSNRVFAVANKPQAQVLSIGEGQVISVQQASSVTECGVYTGQSSEWLFFFSECYLFVSQGVAPDFISGAMFRVDRADAYEVMVSTQTDDLIRYYVKSPMVSVGDVIAKGCIIGDTLQLLNLVAAEINTINAGIGGEGGIGAGVGIGLESETGISFTALDLNGGTDRLLPHLTEDHDPLQACNVNPLYSSCMGDGQLRDPSAWQSTGLVQWDTDGSGAILQPGARIAQTLALGSGEYEFNVRARRLGTFATTLILQLGETVQEDEVRYELDTYVIPAAAHDPDAGQLYTVAISNLGNSPMEILSACVSDGNGGEALGTCGFSNPSFDYGLTNWDHTGDVFLGLTDGEIWMEDDTDISQAINLYPNGAQSYAYDITVEARLPADYAEITGTVAFSWEYDGGSGDFISPASTTTFSFASFFARAGSTPSWSSLVTFEALVTIATPSSGPFVINAHINDAPADVGVTVTRVCINDPFAHHPDTTGGETLPFPINCERIAVPAGDGVGEWIFYHWSNLDRFFQCDLMILMNRMWNTMFNTYRTIQWGFLYGQASMDKTGRWFGNVLFPWLEGHFRNMALGQVTTVIQGESGGCTDIWCVLGSLIDQVFGPLIGSITRIVDTLLGIIEQVSTLLLAVVSTLLALALILINRMLELGILGQNMLGSLLTAYNSSPALPIPGIPDCGVNPPEGICKGIWVVDNTIFSEGTAGAIIPTLLTAFLSIHLTIFVVARIRHIIMSVGRSV